MNNLTIPPSGNWYEPLILACAPDNTLIYGSRSDIVIIYNTPDDQPSDVQIICKAHSQKIVSTNINKNWGLPYKLLVTVAEDNIIKLWDIETRKKKCGHNAHTGQSKVVGATFAGDDRVISVSEEGNIVIWNTVLNQVNHLKDIFGLKVSVTCVSTCPHANWLTAFGLKNGLVVVADLRKQGKVLYKLRGHDKSVLSLSWCPAPVNIFPKEPYNYVGVKNLNTNNTEAHNSNENVGEKTEAKSAKSVDLIENTEKDRRISNSPIQNKTIKKNNIWTNLKHVDDDEQNVSMENETGISSESESFPDFLEECRNMKSLIKGEDTPDETVNTDKKRTVLKANRKHNQEIVSDDSTHKVEDTVNEVCKDILEDITQKLETEQCSVEKETSICVMEKVDAEESLPIPVCKSNTEIIVEESHKDDANEVNDLLGGNVNESITDDVEKSTNSYETTSEEMKREIPLNKSVEEEPRRDFLLASSGREGNIYIWRAGTDGRLQTFLTVPNKNGSRKFSKAHHDKTWIVLCWISPTILLSSSKYGELISWTLPKPRDKSKQFSVVHNDHKSLLFSIAAPIVYVSEYNWLDEGALNVWTFGQDRLLLNTSLSSKRMNLCCYPTLGNAECLALSPLDPNKIAIGTRESTIRVWDLSRPNVKNITMTIFYQKIQSRVVALAWHPTNEMILAYGTIEGRIGFFDVSQKKPPTVSPHFFKTQIHRIEWGPTNGNIENMSLYATAEGKLVIFSQKSTEAPNEMDVPDDTFVYSFSWKPDFSMLLVGTRTGSVIIYSTDLKIISTHYFQHKLRSIQWHPTAIQSDLNISKYCYWFMAVSNSNVIVCNLQRDVEDNEKIVATFEGSEDAINCISWSPFDSNKAVIACNEGLAQVWDVESNAIVSTYVSPNFEDILSSLWTPVDPDCIISSVKDHTIRIWRISEHPRRDINEIKTLKKATIREIHNEQSDLLPKAEKTPEEALKNKKTTKNDILPCFYYTKNTTQTVNDLRKLLLWKEGSHETEAGEEKNNSEILKIFGTKDDMLDIITKNDAVHLQKGKYTLSNTLSLFKGDISDKIKQAIEEKRVNSWVIMMAPMVSPKVWRSACEVYAQQLSEMNNSDPLEIATYYLACHKVEDAINVLCEGVLFREAFALAKCRLPEDSPIILTVMEKWIKYSVAVGNFEIAAQCYIYLGKYDDAASILFRRSDKEILKFALELAEKSGNEDLYKAVLFRYIVFNNDNTESGEGKENTLPSKIDLVLKEHLECKDKVLDNSLSGDSNGTNRDENGDSINNLQSESVQDLPHDRIEE